MRPQGPNLLYIHSDQHNPYVTGCYGDLLVQTPHLDSLAVEGIVFENGLLSISDLCAISDGDVKWALPA